MMEGRPEADSKKLAGQFDEWLGGETLVGRVLASPRTGRLPGVLDAAVNGSGGKPAEVWNTWERGMELPLVVNGGLRDGGLAELLVGVGDVAQAGE